MGRALQPGPAQPRPARPDPARRHRPRPSPISTPRMRNGYSTNIRASFRRKRTRRKRTPWVGTHLEPAGEQPVAEVLGGLRVSAHAVTDEPCGGANQTEETASPPRARATSAPGLRTVERRLRRRDRAQHEHSQALHRSSARTSTSSNPNRRRRTRASEARSPPHHRTRTAGGWGRGRGAAGRGARACQPQTAIVAAAGTATPAAVHTGRPPRASDGRSPP